LDDTRKLGGTHRERPFGPNPDEIPRPDEVTKPASVALLWDMGLPPGVTGIRVYGTGFPAEGIAVSKEQVEGREPLPDRVARLPF